MLLLTSSSALPILIPRYRGINIATHCTRERKCNPGTKPYKVYADDNIIRYLSAIMALDYLKLYKI